MALIFFWQAVALQSADIEFGPTFLPESVTGGIPAVVRLTVRNQSKEEKTIFDLYDPFLFFTKWSWECSDFVHPIRSQDLGFNGLPKPRPRQKITLATGETKIWYVTLPTPFDFAHDNHWSIRLEVDLSESDHRHIFGPIPAKRRRPSKTIGALTPRLAQAALLQFSRGDALQQIDELKLWPIVEQEGKNADPVANLLLYSRALLEGDDVAKYWLKLDVCDPEVRCLRNYLYLHRADAGIWNQSQPLTTLQQQTVIKMVKPDDYFAAEILKNIESN